MSHNTASVDVLILGCGYLGRRAAAEWIRRGKTVAALTRSRSHELAAAGITPIPGDVCDASTLVNLPNAKTVLYAIGLDRGAGHSMRDVYVYGLTDALDAMPKDHRLIYVSSTSVYGQTDGDWVDECSPTEPLEESGRVVLDAEATLIARRPDAIRLRFAGIYGPGRLLREKAIVNGEPLGGDPDKWLNLIHVDDGVQAVLDAEANAQPGDLYLVADDEPVTRRDFYTHLAAGLQAPRPGFDGAPSNRETHRRIRNTLMKNRLGVDLHYPDYRRGLDRILAATRRDLQSVGTSPDSGSP